MQTCAKAVGLLISSAATDMPEIRIGTVPHGKSDFTTTCSPGEPTRLAGTDVDTSALLADDWLTRSFVIRW